MDREETIKLTVKSLLEIVQTGAKNIEITVMEGYEKITVSFLIEDDIMLFQHSSMPLTEMEGTYHFYETLSYFGSPFHRKRTWNKRKLRIS